MKKINPTELKGFIANKHQPYTDYNEEIADWLMENAEVDNLTPLNYGGYIFTDEQGTFYGQKIIYNVDKYYTNEEFKKWIGMDKKATSHLKELISEYKEATKFTKADLKDGMVCTTRGDNVYTVQGDRMTRGGGMYMLLEDIDDDLTVEDLPELDIVSVQQTITVFERVDEKKLAIQKELEFAKAKAERLAAHISVLETKLKQ